MAKHNSNIGELPYRCQFAVFEQKSDDFTL